MKDTQCWWIKLTSLLIRETKTNIQEGRQLQAFLADLVFLWDPGGGDRVVVSDSPEGGGISP